ncbi:GNAT family N-acetyltransferase [Streptomyces sp. NPDC057695]|uniref:GNAT family N-acetyltransferase n=1 Tax=Streptomyces sp. NPDC057695 TaxID=3346217 RepID=UPI003686AA44
MTSETTLRRATGADALPAAGVWLRSFAAALPSVRCAHDEADVRDWFARVLVPAYETWVAVADATVVGVLVLNGPELKQLYLEPEWRGRGLGDRFISLAKEQRPGGLSLWTFQVNRAARRFYERHGFTETERTDGSRNDEREPDVRYLWQPGGRGEAASPAA